MRQSLTVALCLCFLGLAARPAAAQVPPDQLAKPWTTAQITFGPIYLAPTFELKDVGIDNNVLNDEVNPKSDLTGTLAMRTLAGIHLGGDRLVFQVQQNNAYIWYRRYRSERSIDGTLNFVLELRTAMFRPWVRWDKTKSSQRQGYEIDERAERKTPTFDFGLDFTAPFRIGASATMRRARLRFADTEEYDGTNLSEALDSNSDAYTGFLRYAFSEYTDFIVGVDYSRDRFTKSPLRDNDSENYYAGVSIKTGTVFTGSATVGFRNQSHLVSTVPNYRGLTANVGMGILPNEFFRFEVNATRDMQYTYQELYPFMIEEGASASMTNRFAEHFDAVYSARWRRLSYNETINGLTSPHSDRTVVLGLGAGYYVGGGSGTRLGLLFEHTQRVSPIAGRSFTNNRISSNYRFSF